MQNITINANDDGTKLFRFIMHKFNIISKVLIYKLCRLGQIRINSKRCSGNEILKLGDIVKIPYSILNNTNVLKKSEDGSNFTKEELESLRQSIIYNDDDIVILNKPAGLSVQGGTNIKKSVDKMIQKLFPSNKILLTHRLDKETSGILILAKNQKSAQNLTKQFLDKKVVKEYIALLNGNIKNKKGIINNYIYNKQVFNEYKKGFKIATTEYSVVGEINNVCSLVIFKPKTGRTHQLRLHSYFSLNASIVGDKLYCKEQNDLIKELANVNKMFLCAYKVSFYHPKTNKFMTFKIQPPLYFNKILKLLEIKCL